MKSEAKTVEEYLAELLEDRREAIEMVRALVWKIFLRAMRKACTGV